MLLSDRYSGVAGGDAGKHDRSPEAEALRQQIYESMKNKPSSSEEKSET